MTRPLPELEPGLIADGLPEEIPQFRIQENVCPVVANDSVNAEYKHLILAAPSVALAARPGQFFHILCPKSGDDAPFLRRPMSVYRVDQEQRQIEFLYKVHGAGTRGLATLQRGDTLDVFGPLGKGFDIDRMGRHALILARGVGLATMGPLAEAAAARGVATTAILSIRRPELVMSVDLLERVGARVVIVNDLDSSSDVAAVEESVRALHRERSFDYIATCGSDRLFQLAKRLSGEFAIPAEVALEQNMGCAIGMCFCCVRSFKKGETVTYKRVCWDGPVFDVQEALSW